ncbi:DUF4336 domain-containing protein [Psychromarinibacter sp. C21-152]|uniref:DUF4336 domain-containing protein n=1 Tax=Psychromarinibacter sediminicola TaxID=3033385 RepID=A0AAE3TB62_9RHOB|nr:DUF4336 domain-containing protein [Psychromarinibacter sediminicola]MDF0603503.1 DUF4336 domain-containing protein [Psychromarinibacter sediminicola]
MQVYAPLDELKPVGDGIWVVDGPTIRFYGVPFPTRMTVVRLADGAVWVHSPIRLSEALAEAVAALGPVAHLVAPNQIHYAYLPDWSRRFPGASVWAAPGVAERAADHDVAFPEARALDGAEPWPGEIDCLVVGGSAVHHEAVFFHRASRTLILTDLIENFEPARVPWWFAPVAWLAGIKDPDGAMPRDMRWTFRKGRAELRAAVETMIGWGPEKVIVAHGRWYERDGVAELRRAFRFVL